MQQTKFDMVIAAAITGMGAGGISLHGVLEATQLVASIVATVLGAGYLAWKWHRDIRKSKRRDRRAGDADSQD